MRRIIRHFLTPDHLAFLLILPALFISSYLAVGCWVFALVWDLVEARSKKLQRIERWFKGV